MVQLVDTALVGHLGEDALAGVRLAGQIFWFSQAGMVAVGVGATAIIARSVGAGEGEHASSTLRSAILMAFLWGVLAFVLSFIPLFGTTPVTLGAAIYLFASGRQGAAIVMLVGMVVIGASDNLVRPLVASGSGNLHPLLTLVAIFGGLAAIGASGIFFGPIIAALAVWALGYQGRIKAPPDLSE